MREMKLMPQQTRCSVYNAPASTPQKLQLRGYFTETTDDSPSVPVILSLHLSPIIF